MHLAGLTNLEELNLDHPQVTDAGLVHLAGLTRGRSVLVMRLIGSGLNRTAIAVKMMAGIYLENVLPLLEGPT